MPPGRKDALLTLPSLLASYGGRYGVRLSNSDSITSVVISDFFVT
jgi:hypothetical protein